MVTVPRVCAAGEVNSLKWKDVNSCSKVQTCFGLAVAMFPKYKADLSPSVFFFSALQGPFDSPKGKSCLNVPLCWCCGLHRSLLLPYFMSPIYHSSQRVIPLHWVMRVIDGSRWFLSTWRPVFHSSFDLLIIQMHCSELHCLWPD